MKLAPDYEKVLELLCEEEMDHHISQGKQGDIWISGGEKARAFWLIEKDDRARMIRAEMRPDLDSAWKDREIKKAQMPYNKHIHDSMYFDRDSEWTLIHRG